MDDKKTDENLEEEETLSQNENRTYTQEELDEKLNKYKSSSDRSYQETLKEKKFFEKATEAVADVARDKTKLVEISEADSELGKFLLEKYYNGMDIEDYKQEIGYEEDLNNPDTFKRKMDREVKKREAKKIVTTSVNDYVEKYKMTDGEKEKFLEAFEERKGLKSFNVEDISKHLDKAYKEIMDEEEIKTFKANKAEADAVAVSGGDSGTKSNPVSKTRKEAREFLNQFGM